MVWGKKSKTAYVLMGKGTGPDGGQVTGEDTHDVHGWGGGKPAQPSKKGSTSELQDRANEQVNPGKGSFHVLLWGHWWALSRRVKRPVYTL